MFTEGTESVRLENIAQTSEMKISGFFHTQPIVPWWSEMNCFLSLKVLQTHDWLIFFALYFFANIYQLGRCYIEVASVIYRKGFARAGSWFIKSTFPPFDTIVTGMRCYTKARVCINVSVVVIVGMSRSKITIRSFQISQDYLCHRRVCCCSDA